MDHCPVMAKGLAELNEAMRHAMEGHPRWTGHSGEFWQNVVHWRREWQTTPVFLPWEPLNSMKRQKDSTSEDDRKTHRLRKQTYRPGWRMGFRVKFGMDTYTLLYLKWITSKALLSSTGKPAQCCVAAWMGGESGRMDTCTCLAESLCCSPETSTALLISYSPNKVKSSKKVNKVRKSKCGINIHVDTDSLTTLHLGIWGRKTARWFAKSDDCRAWPKGWLWCCLGEKRCHKPRTKRGFCSIYRFPNSQKYTFASFSSAPQKYFPFSSIPS